MTGAKKTNWLQKNTPLLAVCFVGLVVSSAFFWHQKKADDTEPHFENAFEEGQYYFNSTNEEDAVYDIYKATKAYEAAVRDEALVQKYTTLWLSLIHI